MVNSLVAPDATYVSLNTENSELARIMPWVGASHGPQAFLGNLGRMFTRWHAHSPCRSTATSWELSELTQPGLRASPRQGPRWARQRGGGALRLP